MREYGGAEKRRYRGMSKLEVWNDGIARVKQRVCRAEDLDLLLMRTSGYQKVKRKGVFITISGEKLWYSGLNTVWHLDKDVYVRYDPTDLSSVRIYDKEDRYVDTWQADTELILRFFDNSNAVADANEKLAAQKKMVKEYAKSLTDGMASHTKIDILALTVERAQQRKKEMYIAQGQVVEPVILPTEVPADKLVRSTRKTGTDNITPIDIARMNENAARRKGLE